MDKIEEGIERFINYIKRMNKLNDEQMDILLGVKIQQDPAYYTSIGVTIEDHRQFIRRMASRTDAEIRKFLKDQVEINKDPVWIEIFEDSAKKKAIIDMEKSAKDMRSDPRSFTKKIGSDIEFSVRKVDRN